MRRVVITGLGISSCLGRDKDTIAQALRNSTSGIRFNPEYAEVGMRSHISGSVDIDFKEEIDRKLLRFMGDAASHAYVSLRDAIADAGLAESDVSNTRTGIIAGSGGAASSSQVEAADIARAKGVKKVGPYRVTQVTVSYTPMT
ncbi:beta-ketoacyl-ACP synthase I, partial [bacterium]|nr:beta-ketoacyl-ACP synthase I [bacterium]